MLAHGEVIKFLHQAIEWENMLFFLHPYFWSHTSRWELKKYLDHPDFLHKTFLKSGSARVVLTIRPGFEKDFVSLLETGALDGLDPHHPYLTIAQEMQNFAQTTNAAYPDTAQGLAALAQLGTVPAADLWGYPYQYRSPGLSADFELASLAADGQVGGDGENADIESWVDASLISRWYEYTSTSAVDIAFNETMPGA